MDCTDNSNKKRVQDDSDMSSDSSESKRVRNGFDGNSSELRNIGSYFINRVDSEKSGSKSREAQQIRNEILDILEEPDTVSDNDSAIQDLDSVIKSFQEEILHPSPAKEVMPIPDSGESQPDLGYLLEASDDELGLPPAVSRSTREELVDLLTCTNTAVAPEAATRADLVGIEEQVPSYDWFELELVTESEGCSNRGFAALGGMFELDEPSDFSEFVWQPESLPAV